MPDPLIVRVPATGYSIAEGVATGFSKVTATGAALRPMPPEHPYYALIGQVASHAAHLDHLLDLIIWNLAAVEPNLGACLTGSLVGSYPRYRIIVQLAELRCIPKATIRKIEKQAGLAAGLADRRNRTVHDPWFSDITSDEASQFLGRPPKKPVYGFKTIPTAEIENTIADFAKSIQAVAAIRTEMVAALHP